MSIEEEILALLQGVKDGDLVAIPRAQYEAYRVAAKALPGAQKIIGDLKGRDVWREYDAICNALHALRAAGIQIEGEGQ